MIGLLDKIKTALENDATLLGYVETVVIGKYDPAAMPDFETFAIVVSPADSLRMTDVRAVREKQHTVQVDIFALRWRWNVADSVALLGSDPRGIIKFAEEVWSCLNNNDLNGYIEGPENIALAWIKIGSINNDSYYEAQIPLSCVLPSFAE